MSFNIYNRHLVGSWKLKFQSIGCNDLLVQFVPHWWENSYGKLFVSYDLWKTNSRKNICLFSWGIKRRFYGTRLKHYLRCRSETMVAVIGGCGDGSGSGWVSVMVVNCGQFQKNCGWSWQWKKRENIKRCVFWLTMSFWIRVGWCLWLA